MKSPLQQLYENEQSGKDPTQLLFEAHRRIADRFLEERKREQELKELEERLYQRVMKSIDIKVVDNATPALKALEKQLQNLGGRRR